MVNLNDDSDRQKYHFLSGDSIFILDLLRVIACEMVVVGHAILLYTLFFKDQDSLGLLSFIAPHGVILFFFISGIVISNSLIKKIFNGGYSFSGYFIDRFSRLYSGLVPCLVILIILELFINTQFNDVYSKVSAVYSTGLSLYGIIGCLFMLQAFPIINPPIPPFASPLWTLNVEWWLYMLFGWLALKFQKIVKLEPFTLLILAVFAFFPLYKFFASDNNLIVIWFSGVLITIILMNSKKLSIVFNI